MSRPVPASAKRRRARAAAPTSVTWREPPEVSSGRRAALLLGCYRAAAEHEDPSLALVALKLRRFSGRFGGGRVSFQAEVACLVGVCGRLADVVRHVSNNALEQARGNISLLERKSLTSHELATLLKDALLATEELEALRLAYSKKKTASARG